jgi:hypothetical protein
MVIRGRDASAISAAVVIGALLGAGVVHTGPAWAEPLDPNSAAYLNSVRSLSRGRRYSYCTWAGVPAGCSTLDLPP